MAKLVPIGSVSPSAYNPRQADDRRLDLVALSLRKLGFLLPIYADASGEVLSGHQRQLVAERIGCKQVPVEFTKPFDLAERKAINLAFNRATNDFRQNEGSQTASAALELTDIAGMAAALPDVDPESAAMFPCMDATEEPIDPILKANAGRWNQYALALAGSLARRGIVMPVVVGPDGVVVNGIGRLEHLARTGAKTVRVVRLDAQRAAFAGAMLNLLSMDFDVHTRYRDLLRYNSFRRARATRRSLGRGFLIAAAPEVASKDWPLNAANARRWRAIHGDNIVDFGAGHLHETVMLREIGVTVAAFEPFRLGADLSVDKDASVSLAREFLAQVAEGRPFTSVFISSVLNSVPYEEDRKAIVTICAALTGAGRLYAAARSVRDPNWEGITRGGYMNDVHASTSMFTLDYEPGITLGGVVGDPKVQKFHTSEEFYALFKTRFSRVAVKARGNNVEAICADPLPVDVAALRDALAFEFELPYPDGSRMGLEIEARAAFGKRLGIEL